MASAATAVTVASPPMQSAVPSMAPAPPAPPSGASSLSFTQGFLVGQFSIALLIFCFIKFFIFGEPPSADDRALHLSSLRRARTLAHQQSRQHLQQQQQRTRSNSTTTPALRRQPSRSVITKGAESRGGPSIATILAKTYYNVQGHQPESLDWFNVLVAQTIAQLRADARQDDAVLASLTDVLNAGSKPAWIGPIRVTEIALGDEFPIFSNCRVMPAEDGFWYGPSAARDSDGRLQARMDVDLGDVITIGIETTLNLNWPKPLTAVLPVALAVTIERFSGTLAMSFVPSSSPAPPAATPSPPAHASDRDRDPPRPSTSSSNPSAANPAPHRPTSLAFTFLDDYRLDLSVRSLVGSRSRLQDVPKIAQLIEARVHAWFDERAVEPRFQQISLPSLWPRKHNTRGGATADPDADADPEADCVDASAVPLDDHVAVPAAGLGLDVPHAPPAATLEERIEAEGAKLRDAEIRAGERKAPRRGDDGMRWRGEPGRGRDADRPQAPNRFKSEHYSGQKGMPGAMLE
ncbi:hypothetical protein C7974DRAFT_425849 [Boeremia exigua]|uniref:uncharacterized protein n=1 Tax=Boeremia exigua TaxID=749465 RepID=UPI001E8ECA5B|nr:uncharacterized protein C7974DRAFT_425849 [Boeremia exigua]KAH6622132.1 hypothetical protein C7974DRAFT_425849 [Boeremia exigua]